VREGDWPGRGGNGPGLGCSGKKRGRWVGGKR